MVKVVTWICLVVLLMQMASDDWICRSLNCHDQMMGYLSMNWMGHEAPRVGVVAKDHVEEEGEAGARNHALLEMVQGHGEEEVGSDGQRFPWTRQSGCGHNNHHRNYPANTKYEQVWWETKYITCNTRIRQESILIPETLSVSALCFAHTFPYCLLPIHLTIFYATSTGVEKTVYFWRGKKAFFKNNYLSQ